VRIVPALLCAVVLGGCAGGEREHQSATDRYVEMYRALHPAVVLFTMQIPSDDPKRKGKFDEAFGSGVVVASGSWGSRILTDAHVVADAKELIAQIGDGKSAPAHVIATSGDDDDVAIVETSIPNTTVAALGTAQGIEPGNPIGVLGYPIPDAFTDERLGTTVSLYTGRVASVRKGALELDVPIIPGESGGPVFDAQTGKVIGIAESRFEEERAIGFATPIDVAVKFLAAHPR
jgi:serine protease DegQ